MTTAKDEQSAGTPTTTPVQPKAIQPASPQLTLSSLPPTVPPSRQSSPSLFKQPSLPSSRSFPSLLSLASSSAASSSASSLPPPSSSPSSHLRRVNSDLCRQGNACFALREFDSAISLYTGALELSFDDWRTWNNRATAYVAKRLYRMGIRDYHEAIARAPHCGELYYKRGVAWSALAQYAYAIEDYSRCLELRHDYPDALNNRGNAYRILGQYRLARTDLLRAVQLVPSSQLYQHNLRKVEAALADEDKTGSTAQQRAIQQIVQSVLQARLQQHSGAGAASAGVGASASDSASGSSVPQAVSAEVERLLRQLIISKQRGALAPSALSPSSSPSHTSAFSPVSPSSSSSAVSASSLSSSSLSSSSLSLSSIIDSLPAPVMNHLLQYFHSLQPKQQSSAQSDQQHQQQQQQAGHRRSGSKRSRSSFVRSSSSVSLSSSSDEEESDGGKRVRLASKPHHVHVYTDSRRPSGDELYDDDRSVDDSDVEGTSSPTASDGSRSPDSGNSERVDGRLDVAEMDSCKRPIAV